MVTSLVGDRLGFARRSSEGWQGGTGARCGNGGGELGRELGHLSGFADKGIQTAIHIHGCLPVDSVNSW
jgi:hypothetical protein